MKQKGPELELVTQSCHFCLAERESEKKKKGGNELNGNNK